MGTDLEHVEFRSFDEDFFSRLALDTISKNCPNISRLAMKFGNNDLSVSIEEICIFYGSGLLQLDVSNDRIGIPALERIVAACPNVAIKFSNRTSIFDGSSTDTVVSLGPHSSSWAVETSARCYCDTSFSRIGSSCPNLQECWVTSNSSDYLTETAFAGLFIQPKLKLRYLNVSAEYRPCIDAMLTVLSSKVNSIETFV